MFSVRNELKFYVQLCECQLQIVNRIRGRPVVSKVKVNQSHHRPEVPRGFQEFKVPRLRNNGLGW